MTKCTSSAVGLSSGTTAHQTQTGAPIQELKTTAASVLRLLCWLKTITIITALEIEDAQKIRVQTLFSGSKSCSRHAASRGNHAHLLWLLRRGCFVELRVAATGQENADSLRATALQLHTVIAEQALVPSVLSLEICCCCLCSQNGSGEAFGAAIRVLLDHYAAMMDQGLLCSIACVCKEWNTAVQHAETGALEVTYEYTMSQSDYRYDSIKQDKVEASLLSLSTWLSKYGKLVCGVHDKTYIYPRDKAADQYRRVAGPILSSGLQAAAQRGLRLCSFSSHLLLTSIVLEALPCTTLTHLAIKGHEQTVLAATLRKLTNLELLDLEEFKEHLAVCLPAMRQLKQLTALSLNTVQLLDTLHLPVQLQQLTLFRHNPDLWEPQLVDLAHLTRLTKLDLKLANGIAQGSSVPGQMLELNVDMSLWRDGSGHADTSATEVCQLTSLSQLQRLRIWDSCETAPELLQLASLPRLQQLSLGWSYRSLSEVVVEAACAWPQILQLQEICVPCERLTMTQIPVLLGHIASTTGLTRLEFQTCCSYLPRPACGPLDLCQFLSRLQGLKELKTKLVDNAIYWSGQAHFVTPLTSLTRLQVQLGSYAGDRYISLSAGKSGGGKELSDAFVIASLQHLHQRWSRQQDTETQAQLDRSMASLQVTWSLRHLRRLAVNVRPSSWTGCSHLRALRKLNEVGGSLEYRQDVLAEFWAAMRVSVTTLTGLDPVASSRLLLLTIC